MLTTLAEHSLFFFQERTGLLLFKLRDASPASPSHPAAKDIGRAPEMGFTLLEHVRRPCDR
jgi:hypothetical protein